MTAYQHYSYHKYAQVIIYRGHKSLATRAENAQFKISTSSYNNPTKSTSKTSQHKHNISCQPFYRDRIGIFRL